MVVILMVVVVMVVVVVVDEAAAPLPGRWTLEEPTWAPAVNTLHHC